MKKKYLFDNWMYGKNKPIELKMTVKEGELPTDLLNVDFQNGMITKRVGWKTFKGMVKELDKLNKKYKKMGITGDFTIRLPIRGSV